MKRLWFVLPVLLVLLVPRLAWAANVGLTAIGGSNTTDLPNMTDGDSATFATTDPPGFMSFGFTSQPIVSVTLDVSPVSGSSNITVRLRRTNPVTWDTVPVQTANGRVTLTFTPPSGDAYDAVEMTPSTSIRWYEVTVQNSAPSAPSAPTGLSGQLGATPGTVDLSWSASSGATGYKVYRNGSAIGTPTGTSYTDNNPTPGTAPVYHVTATNAGVESTQSNQITVTIPALPGAPENLSTAISGASVVLTWSAPSTGTSPTGYRVYRDGSPIGTVTTTTYTDTAAASGTTYTYTVGAYNGGGYGPLSSPSTITTTAPASPPDAPTALSATPGPERALLSWSPPATGPTPTGYRVYRDGAQVATVAGTTYTDTGLTTGVAYSYHVTAYNAAGESGDSETATVTPEPFSSTGNLWRFPITGLGQAVTDTVGSMSPVFLITAGLILAGGVLSWGIGMLRTWRGGR